MLVIKDFNESYPNVCHLLITSFICIFLTFILSVNSFFRANVICYTVILTLNKSYLILSYLILSYLILSYLILSYLILS